MMRPGSSVNRPATTKRTGEDQNHHEPMSDDAMGTRPPHRERQHEQGGRELDDAKHEGGHRRKGMQGDGRGGLKQRCKGHGLRVSR
jgi:hypothetical protein